MHTKTAKGRAYSLLTIKSLDDDAREITGIASSPEADRMGDIVLPEGAEFNLPIPLLWQHDPLQPIGEVYYAKATKNGIEIKARLVKAVAPSQLAARLDEAWVSIKTGLVKGLSIGFSAIEYAFLDTGGIRFDKWNWYELSAVTIPANAMANIATVKSFDGEAIRAALGKNGKPATKAEPSSVLEIKQVKIQTTPEPEDKMKTIQEQIAEFRKTADLKKARQLEIVTKSGESGETLAQAEQEEFDGITAELNQIDGHIKRLEQVEKANVASARPVLPAAGTEPAAAAASRQSVPAQVKNLSDEGEKGIAFARLAICKAGAKMYNVSAHEFASQRYANDPRIANILKSAVAVGTAASGTWAGNLVGQDTKVYADFAEFLRPLTILGKFGTNGIPALRKVPFKTPLLGQTSGGSAGWVGEGAGKPLTKFDFARTTLDPLKVANIAVLTMEVIRDSSPAAEALVRDGLAAAIAERLDIDFIDPHKAASAGVSPASITNGVTAHVSLGTDANQVRCDIEALLGDYIAANNAPTNGVLIMSAITALSLSTMRNALGNKEFPDITMMGGTLEGFPVIVSQYTPADSVGHIVVMVNASDIYIADDGEVQVDMSDQASLQMDSAPTQNSTTATTLVSLWQNNLIGFRAERTINWSKRRPGAVSLLSHVNWNNCT